MSYAVPTTSVVDSMNTRDDNSWAQVIYLNLCIFQLFSSGTQNDCAIVFVLSHNGSREKTCIPYANNEGPDQTAQ